MKHEHVNEIKAILILAASLILLASLVSFVPEDLPWYTSHPNVPAHNLVRIVGAYMAGALFFIFGYSAYAPAVFLSLWSWNKFASRDLNFSLAKLICIVILFCSLSGLFSLFGPNAETYRFQRSGVIGFVLSDFLLQYSGRTGASIILLTITSLTMIVIGEFLISPIVLKCVESFRAFLVKFHGKVQTKIPSTPFKFPPRPELKNARINEKTKAWLKEKESVKPLIKNIKSAEEPAAPIQKLFAPKSVAGKIEKPKIHIATPPKEEAAVIQEKPKVVGNYQIPSPDLLDDPPAISSSRLEDNLVAGAKILEETLSDFNVSVRVADIERGPVITRYELEPAPGVKVQRIITLADDIALALKAPSVRIVAPIPGKNRVGIEVPNGASASVYLKDVISHSDFINSESRLTLAIGKDIAGKPIIADLTEMPHLLIAGTTGSGKTVCVNSLIMSMLFHASPDQVKFLMVDPKMVELTQYNGLPHCLCPAVTDYKKVASALNWVVSEMESRYTTLSKEGVRNIKGYHAKGLTMPYIVVIIDELADLMQVAAKTIESAITRLAQLSRAVGIHLILATQRPSVDVITGVIKANFPARISFKVASKVDSRTVLDMNGAENLLGRGDLLFMKPGDAKPVRGQCSFLKDPEIQRVMEFIKKQQDPDYNESILQHRPSSMTSVDDEKDDFYDEAVKLIMETNQASTSILQRRLRLGYSRAARLIDMMEQEGLIGPYCGSKPRDILIDREDWLLKNMGKGDNGQSNNT
ncbi:MAG: hypothetical protein A3D10_09210 [Omnitrophica WOR_2 bacterium RIFCSPHIGHO2_02_FULL_48_11]|nr:MAG: hypothetical protein A3D10_09210 [Omnitrophica WOR_2 bacterium RIFCSPHIGHO2_02_FULL_48_11]